MVRELRCAAVASLCALSSVACSQEDAPAPEQAPAAPTAVESSSAQPSRASESDANEATPEPVTSAAPTSGSTPQPRRVAAAPPARRALSGAGDSAKPKSDTGAWEDEVAPPGSEVGRKTKQLPEWDPWESRDGTQGNANK